MSPMPIKIWMKLYKTKEYQGTLIFATMAHLNYLGFLE